MNMHKLTQFYNLLKCHFVIGFEHLHMGLTQELNNNNKCTNHRVTPNHFVNLGVS